MPESRIDLRSDTVTRPTAAMREAMYRAEVGDDVYQEDPTVNLLEQRAAEILEKEAALFLPTGTMGNTIGVKLLTTHGQEVICEARGHLMNYELSMTAWFAGCLVRTIASEDGILDWTRIEREIRPLGPHAAMTGCVELENTHNLAGGTVYPQDVLDEICDRSHDRGIRVHLDGARLFNAATATGLSAARIAQKCDTVTFCLSKGLGAPVGSMLAGTRADMDRARLYRKRLGGGMRQAGILAAAGLIALEEMPKRLGEDHSNAQLLAEGFAAIPGVRVVNPNPATNIVILDVTGTRASGRSISAALRGRGVLINAIDAGTMRAVTHYDVSRAQCQLALGAFAEAIATGC